MPLHLKYRPSVFDEVVGQDVIVMSLKEILKKGLAHAFLFTGGSGVGKTTLARCIANALGCERQNIIEIDAATHTGIDAMRSVTETLVFRPIGRCPNRMVIIDEAHALSKPSWSSLLKAIEEPPMHVYWSFCTTEASKVPQTIKTRCSTYSLLPLSEADLHSLLDMVIELEGFKFDEDVLELIVQESQGSARQALVYLEQCAVGVTKAQAAELIKASSESDGVIEICRWLAKGQGINWTKASQLLKNIQGENAESVRLTIVSYLTKCALNSNQNDARRYLGMVESFSGTYFGSEGLAPIALALGRIIFGEDHE